MFIQGGEWHLFILIPQLYSQELRTKNPGEKDFSVDILMGLYTGNLYLGGLIFRVLRYPISQRSIITKEFLTAAVIKFLLKLYLQLQLLVKALLKVVVNRKRF